MFGWSSRIIFLTSAVVLALSKPAWGQEVVNWTADALLHDGRTIPLRFEGNSAKQPYYLSHRTAKLSQFKLEFKHPDTQKTIVWQGERFMNPVLLDIVGSVPYLVLYGRPTLDNAHLYGCPELPYIHLRYGEDGWLPIAPAQFPSNLVLANVSVHDIAADLAGQHLSVGAIAQKIQLHARQSSGLVQERIPRAVADWKTDQKVSSLNERLVRDCRAPRTQQVALALPAPTQGSTEVIESVDYVPERAYEAVHWQALSSDTKRVDSCQKLFKRVELENYAQDLRFADDPTGTKRVPYSRYGEFESGVLQLCDDNAWFVTHEHGHKKMTVTRFTRTGDLALHTSFAKPGELPGLTGSMPPSSLRLDGGNLYFDWVYSRQIDGQSFVKRVLKIRVDAP